MLLSVRSLVLIGLLALSGCAPAPAPAPKGPYDPTSEAWYNQTVSELSALNRQAEDLLSRGKPSEAGALITKGQPLAGRLLTAPQPTLAAMEAASDLDHLYGQMLLANRHHGWARLVFQKNLARWKNWRPQTGETVRRRKLAEEKIAECDRAIAQ